MNLSQYKMKGKDGKWKDKITIGLLFAKLVKKSKDRRSYIGKFFNSVKPTPTDDKLRAENKDLWKKIDRYGDVASETAESMIQYIQSIVSGVEEIENKYKGFLAIGDKKLEKEIKSQSEKQQDPQEVIAALQRDLGEIKRELDHFKLANTDMESEVDKLTKKERMYQIKITQIELEKDEAVHDQEAKILEYKSALHTKDEEITNLKEQIRGQERLMRDVSTKNSSSGYEFESLRKKLAESQHHQDMMTKKVRDYEEIVRIQNLNLKKNTSQNNEMSNTSKYKEKEIEKFKLRFKVLEDELNKRENIILELKSRSNKLNKEVNLKDNEIEKLIVRKNNDIDLSELDKSNKDYKSQIEVLKEMIVGLKAQLKAIEMDRYRQETKIVSLQSQIDSLRINEKRIESLASRGSNSVFKGSIAPKAIGSSPSKSLIKGFESSKDSKYKNSEYTKSKPLIKSSAKVNKDKTASESVLEEIMRSPSKLANTAGDSVQKSKPNIILNQRKSQNSFHKRGSEASRSDLNDSRQNDFDDE